MTHFPNRLQLNIPFDSNNHALIAQKALSPDPVLKVEQSQILYSIKNDNVLQIDVLGIDDRIIRVTANNLLENLKTIIECFEQFS